METDEHDFIEVNGKTYSVIVEEKDVKVSHARLLEDRIHIVVSAQLNVEEKRRTIESLKKRIQKPRRTRFIEPVREFNDGDAIDLLGEQIH